eukprot:1161782-Pelagomonas_calceolata.AAC.24
MTFKNCAGALLTTHTLSLSDMVLLHVRFAKVPKYCIDSFPSPLFLYQRSHSQGPELNQQRKERRKKRLRKPRRPLAPRKGPESGNEQQKKRPSKPKRPCTLRKGPWPADDQDKYVNSRGWSHECSP